MTFEMRGGVLFGGVMVMEWHQNGIARQDDVGGWSSFGAALLGAVFQKGTYGPLSPNPSFVRVARDPPGAQAG